MNHNPRSRAWLRLAVAYFAVGVMLGVAMGASGDHSLFPLHAHINLLGWVSMALFGLIGTVHRRSPRAASLLRSSGCTTWVSQ
jgi:hypothetical protein